MKNNAVDTEVLEAATKLFGDYDAALKWLNSPSLALGGLKPIDARASDVLVLINKISFGVPQ